MDFAAEITLEDVRAHSSDLWQVIENVRQLYLASSKSDETRYLACKFQVSVDLELAGTLQEQAAESLDAFLDRAIPLIQKNAALLVTWPGVSMGFPAVGIPPAVMPGLVIRLQGWHGQVIEKYNDELARQKEIAEADNVLRVFARSRPVVNAPTAGYRWIYKDTEYYIPSAFWDTLYIDDKPVFGCYAVDLAADKLVFLADSAEDGCVVHNVRRDDLSVVASYMFSLRFTRPF